MDQIREASAAAPAPIPEEVFNETTDKLARTLDKMAGTPPSAKGKTAILESEAMKAEITIIQAIKEDRTGKRLNEIYERLGDSDEFARIFNATARPDKESVEFLLDFLDPDTFYVTGQSKTSESQKLYLATATRLSHEIRKKDPRSNLNQKLSTVLISVIETHEDKFAEAGTAKDQDTWSELWKKMLYAVASCGTEESKSFIISELDLFDQDLRKFFLQESRMHFTSDFISENRNKMVRGKAMGLNFVDDRNYIREKETLLKASLGNVVPPKFRTVYKP